jgi:hypothetical protein
MVFQLYQLNLRNNYCTRSKISSFFVRKYSKIIIKEYRKSEQLEQLEQISPTSNNNDN